MSNRPTMTADALRALLADAHAELDIAQRNLWSDWVGPCRARVNWLKDRLVVAEWRETEERRVVPERG